MHHRFRLNFLSINRFERKKNLELAISSFALLCSSKAPNPDQGLAEATLTVAGDHLCLFLFLAAV